MLSSEFKNTVLQASGAEQIDHFEHIQELWSGYGQILRCHLQGGPWPSVVVKHVRPSSIKHPRGWDTNFSHQRKVQSYIVEVDWYRMWSELCPDACRVARCLTVQSDNDQTLMVLEDLDAAGYPRRTKNPTPKEVQACLRWQEHFHARFMGHEPNGLWPQGTYWHLATRPDELFKLDDQALREAAPIIDATLEASPFKTFVHGDAKLANFCFAADGDGVAAVDFQYVGGGCGMKDVVYFIGSCFDERECEVQEEWLLATYFRELHQALAAYQPEIDAAAVEQNWRELFPVAWTDFYRFLKGWSPGHWKLNAYSEKLAKTTLSNISA